LLQSRGFDGDLGSLVSEAKKLVDIDILSSYSEESEHDKQSVKKSGASNSSIQTPKPAMRMPARAGMSPAPLARPGSAKGLSPRPAFAAPIITQTLQRVPPQQPILPDPHSHHEVNSPDHDDKDHVILCGPSIVDLSPNTVVSNNAPSLVSDDGEYDDGDDGGSIRSDIGDDHASVAEVDIEEDTEVHPRATIRHREGNGEGSMRLRKEDKHVTFVGPVKSGDERQKHR